MEYLGQLGALFYTNFIYDMRKYYFPLYTICPIDLEIWSQIEGVRGRYSIIRDML